MTQSGRAAWSVVTAMAVGLSLWSLSNDAVGQGPAGCCVFFSNSTNMTGCSNLAAESLCDLSNGSFTENQTCADDNISCRPPVTGCCNLVGGPCFENLTDLDCSLLSGSEFSEDAVCGNTGCETPTATATATATATDTATPTATATETATATATATATDTATLPPPTDTATATATATDTATASATATATDTPTAAGTPTMIPDGGSCTDPLDCVSGNCVDDVCCESACDGADEACNLPGLEGNCLSLAATVPAASNNGLIAAIAAVLAIGVLAVARRRISGR